MLLAYSTLIATCFALLGACLPQVELPGSEIPATHTPSSASEQAELADGNNQFACDLLARLGARTPGNLFLSPFSIRTALAMTYAGAGGATAAEMKRVLHFTLGDDRLHPGMADAIARLNAGGAGRPQLVVANSLWGERSYDVLPSFLRLNEKIYGSGIERVDFKTASEAARQQINGWVAERTRQKIVDLIPPAGVDASTSLVLVNAVYFKGSWKQPFDPSATTAADWAGSRKQVRMMKRMARYGYAEQRLSGTAGPDTESDAGRVQILELPYAGDTLSMLVLLPPPGTALADVVRDLTAAKLATAVAALQTQTVAVSLPRFSLTWGTTDLGSHGTAVLPDLGMKQAFIPGQADFSGIDGRTVGRHLHVGGVFHKAFVEVQEEGTEAAAATAGRMVGGSSATPSPPVSFRADRPFLFVIRERASGMILFAGRLESP